MHPALRFLRLAFVVCCTALGLSSWQSSLCVAAPLPQEVYVWQRSWSDPVRDTVRQHGNAFSNVVALRAEVTWKAKHPNIVHVPLDYGLLRELPSTGLALRIGPYPGPFLPDDEAGQTLTTLARSMVAEARTNGLPLRELQLDFDCAESKLDGYRTWVRAIRSAIRPVPLTVTVLPSWLDQRSFARLLAETDGYVLQVHSLERPRNTDSVVSLCNPAVARKAVQRAAPLKLPFRVALPTYGYVLGFDPQGQFLGLSAEGPLRSWPSGTTTRELRADPLSIAALVQFWAANRPDSMQGIIWYRLPVSDDTLNWRWPTLSAIIALRSPHESMRAESRRVEAGLVEIILANTGELDISSRLALEVRWSRESGTRLLAADGLRGFQVVEQNASALRLESRLFRLPAGEKRVVGWVRFNSDREVQVEWKKL